MGVVADEGVDGFVDVGGCVLRAKGEEDCGEKKGEGCESGSDFHSASVKEPEDTLVE